MLVLASHAPRVDFVPYPPTSFPVRDLLVLEQMAFRPEDRVCEIGVGSGATAARLARLCSEVVGLEISRETVASLRYLEERVPNLKLVVADVTEPDDLRALEGSFSRVIACDTLEHVADPGAFFHALYRLLAPGGEFLVTFPNEPEDKMHGITRFPSAVALTTLLERAGLAHCRVGSVVLSAPARTIADGLGWAPVRALRTLLRRGSYTRAVVGDRAPQTFERTHFMQHVRTYQRFSPALNLYWCGVLKLMGARGPAFEIDWRFHRAPFTDCQVIVVGRRPFETRPRSRRRPEVS